jgi:hypothetical protein
MAPETHLSEYLPATCPSQSSPWVREPFTDCCWPAPANNIHGGFRRAYCLYHRGDRTSETSVYFYETTWRNIPEGCHFHTRRRENLKISLDVLITNACWRLLVCSICKLTVREMGQLCLWHNDRKQKFNWVTDVAGIVRNWKCISLPCINSNPLVTKPKAKRLLGIRKRGWKDNIKMDHKETGCVDLDWIYPAQVRIHRRAMMVINFRIPYKAGNYFTIWMTDC